MSKIDVRIAKVTIDEKGEWVLTVDGTDIREVLYQDRDRKSVV